MSSICPRVQPAGASPWLVTAVTATMVKTLPVYRASIHECATRSPASSAFNALSTSGTTGPASTRIDTGPVLAPFDTQPIAWPRA